MTTTHDSVIERFAQQRSAGKRHKDAALLCKTFDDGIVGGGHV